MKKTIRLMAVMAILLPALAGCSDKKGGNDNAAATEQPAATAEAEEETAAANFDLEGLEALTKKNTLESDDIDFILDQAEILARKAKGMSRKEYNAYLKTLSKQEHDAVFIIALGMEGIKNSKELSGSQKDRMAEIEAQIPAK